MIEAELFDEQNVVEVSDPENTTERYCLCRNPVTRESERVTRQRLIELTKKGLEDERLKQVTRNEVESNGIRFHQITERDEEQVQMLQLLQVTL